MTGGIADLGDVLAHHFTAPAPQPQPTPPMPPAGPWQPRFVEVKACCGGITGDWCTCTCDTTKDRIELAFAPVLWRAA